MTDRTPTALQAPCEHAWQFEGSGFSVDAMMGHGPQRANFECPKCGSRWRMEVIPGTLEPDLTKPPYLDITNRRVAERRKV